MGPIQPQPQSRSRLGKRGASARYGNLHLGPSTGTPLRCHEARPTAFETASAAVSGPLGNRGPRRANGRSVSGELLRVAVTKWPHVTRPLTVTVAASSPRLSCARLGPLSSDQRPVEAGFQRAEYRAFLVSGSVAAREAAPKLTSVSRPSETRSAALSAADLLAHDGGCTDDHVGRGEGSVPHASASSHLVGPRGGFNGAGLAISIE
jgi:hypothetical protein